MFWQQSLTVASLLASALAVPTGHVLHEKRSEWSHIAKRRVESSAVIPVRIALKQRNLELGHDLLMEVSSPDSPRYGQHYTDAQIADLFAPAKETLDAVMSWLMGAGIPEEEIMHYDNRGWLAIDMPVAKAEELFSAEYYEHDFESGSMRLGCDEYYLPAHIAPHVDLVKPGVVMSGQLKKRHMERRETAPPGWHHGPPHYPGHGSGPGHPGLPENLAHCGSNITPPCLKALYDIPQVPAHTNPENVLGFYESEDAFSTTDLNLFFKKFLPHIPQGTHPHVYSVDGGVAPVPVHSQYNTGESDTDLELAYSLVYPQKIVVYEVNDIPNASGETGKVGFLNNFFDAVDGSYCNYTAFGITGDSPKIDPTYPDPRKGGYKGQNMCGTYPLTRVVSISYGEAESYFPKNYLQRQCSEIMKLGMKGHSILNAAGDYGVASFPHSNGNLYGCLSAKGLKNKVYNPDWPSGCPYMTVVGGTRLYPDQTVNDRESAMQVNLTAFNIQTGEGSPEIVLQYFASGGGFSNFFPTASYQKSAVATYLKNNANLLPKHYTANADATNIGQNGGVFNIAGRAYPDVAANGAYLEIYNNGTLERIFGTSLSSPIFASVLTLINEDRTAAGKGPVGFVNPVLYAHPYVLNDIVNGSNPNCGSQGFTAATGWDPVTGLGTPNYPKMTQLFQSLP